MHLPSLVHTVSRIVLMSWVVGGYEISAFVDRFLRFGNL